ncbi:MAG TPA: amino acid adenylation domain-containing protein [Mucilaginibacter sp.]|nr:amino acid adenylation domain-containing protein [Mucilaginibacter sp.]
MEASNLGVDIEPIEFDPFAGPGIGLPVVGPEELFVNAVQAYEISSVDFDPFAGPEIDLIAPVTESQTEIWASCMIGDDAANCAFNECFSLELTGALYVDALQKSLQDVIVMHQSLRMTFSADGASVYVAKSASLIFNYDDISKKSKPEQDKLICEFNKNSVTTPFNLTDGPLFKTQLYKLNDNRHLLTFVVHHIVCDGWSIGIMMQDLSKLYSAYIKGEYLSSKKPPLFTDYAISQLEIEKSAEYMETEKYWLKQFEGSNHVLELPVDFPRPAARTYKSRREDFILNTELANEVKKLGKSTGAGFVTTLLAAFEVFLHQLTGQEDIIIGLPSAGQSATGNYALVGHCVNLLALRSFPKGELSFKNYLATRKTEVLDAYDHQLYTFGSLLKKLNIPRDPSRIPLVPVMFNIDMGLDNDVEFYGLKHKLLSNPREFENFELFLNVAGHEEAPVLEWSYNTQLFKTESIKQMMDSFTFLLHEIVKQPEVLIKNIPLLNAEEVIKQLRAWNNTKYPYPMHSPVHQIISDKATAIPNKTAITFGDQKITYKQLNEQANQLARILTANGVKKGDNVGFSIDRGIEMVVSLLAIMKAGAVYIPLDPQFPLNRINYMLDDSKAVVLLVSEKYEGRYESAAKELILEDAWKSLDKYDAGDPAVEVSGDDLIYILYTSGSTGNPKGVQIMHHNLLNFLLSMEQAPGISANDKLLAVTTISFDIAGLELFLPLIAGAEIVLASAADAKDGRVLLDIIKRETITMMQATPYTWRILLEAGWDEKTPVKVLCGGEALPQELAEKLLPRASSLWNVYGPTETTVWSTIKELKSAEKPITIGRPINNTSVYILDKFMKPLAAGVAGEIYIGGDGVAKGYLNRPGLTTEKFVDDPFTDIPGAKMYRTGDLGKFWANGEIECLGRMDAQVKIRGFRIETGEIEFQLSREKDIKEGVVIARPDQNGVDKLVAFIVFNPDAEGTENPSAQIQNWKDSLKNSLPDYMVPDNFIIVPEMPLTPNGKVDRKTLGKNGAIVMEEQHIYVAPRTDTEKLLAGIWAEYLDIKKVGVHDNFFELGGHSLIAVKVMGRIEKETGKRLPLATLFEAPTVERLAHCFAPGKSITWDSLVPIKPKGNKMPLYMVHGAGLNVLLFNTLAANMSPDQPVYGLQAKGLDGIDEPLDKIEDIAAHYISAVMEQNPSGPYALAGYSFGGIIAFEMARQLEALGKEVKMLAMFDTYAYRSPHYDAPMVKFYKRTRFFIKRVLYTFTFTNGVKYQLKERSTNIKRRFVRMWWNYKYGKNQTQAGIFGYSNKVDVMNEYAEKHYQLKPYDITVEVFRAENRTFYMDDFEHLGWKPYALKGVNIHPIPGEHNTIFKAPNDKAFANILQKCLDEAILK